MHGNRLRDVFPAHHAIELEISKPIDDCLFSQMPARPATAGEACALVHCFMLTAPSTDRRVTIDWIRGPLNLAAGLHVRTAARNGPHVEAVRAVSRTAQLHLCHASLLKRYWANIETEGS
ncbi:hypothetical protein B0T20DRAFT_272541 [Sordaria brevicollis]|uniref:Uncharacterized protein n=1 Tax=Sordaria brevicollis TaxID=83679 RepID=A0AAE0PAN2_SORBR|nr:hypothetical protein B0T20DRAFT_272541 [Sordaria brevicollis]